jgi:hypothetical protein
MTEALGMIGRSETRYRKECGDTSSHPQYGSGVARFLRLTSLAPEIVERILDGDEPEGMSLAKLRNDWSVVWQEQEWGD